MVYYLSRESVLKWLEIPSVYQIKNDELYELDNDSFAFLQECASGAGCKTIDGEFIDFCLGEGILTKDKVLLKRLPIIKSPEPSLRYLELQITSKCNLKCKHCYINPPSPPFRKGGMGGFSELSVKQIREVLREFEEMQGLKVLITGGEPLLHSKFKEINEMFPEFFIRKVLFTNGVSLNKTILKNLNVNEIQISIDGLEKAHDTLRAKGTFKKAMSALRDATDHGFDVSIATMVHPKNLNDFDEMERLFKGMAVREWNVDIPCIKGRLEKNLEFQISPEEGGKYLRYGYGGGVYTAKPGYACGLHLMAVTADGKVAKCTFYSDSPVGSIDEGLRECWKRIIPITLNELACDCEYIESCRGGCRYRASLFGNPKGKDLYRCALYGKL